jgi:hypothetical protein
MGCVCKNMFRFVITSYASHAAAAATAAAAHLSTGLHGVE